MKHLVSVGLQVIFVDMHGHPRAALVTAVHGKQWFEGREAPSVNLVFINRDEDSTDAWGRQIEREASVVHESNQSAHGQFWKLP